MSVAKELGKELAKELVLEGARSLLDWLRGRQAKRERDLTEWRDIQRRHVERRDLSDDPRPKK